MNTIIIPDVHGRQFWKDHIQGEEKLIFLGDYVDPYPEEGISKREAIENFKEILDLDPSRVTLLLGNHDLMYSWGPFKINPCRHDWENDKEITDLFIQNKERFKLTEVRDGVVFSHSGIHPEWSSRHPDLGSTTTEVAENLNSGLWNPEIMDYLWEISYYRGRWEEWSTGSPVWSDVREWIGKDIPESPFQVFGHTQLVDGKIIQEKGWACVDNKHANKLDNNNKILVL